MTTLSQTAVEALRRSGQFDAEWYRETYADVALLGMDPAEHYLGFGHLMGRSTAPDDGLEPAALAALDHPPPQPHRALLEAHEIARNGNDPAALLFARLHLPDHLTHTIDTLRANAALRRNDTDGWLRHLNSYLRHYGAAPLELGHGTTLPDRFRTALLPAVTGGPLITVIMPAWNAEQTVLAAARSILNQTWRNLELLIVDDFSDDRTWEQLQVLAAEDSRVRIFRNAVNVGPYVSKNIMLSLASGTWITGHDADDWAHPQRLEHHMRALQQYPSPPRASVSYMLRFEADGLMDRFSALSGFSLDGAARLASISCTYDADFLRSQLGSWDNVRFGADSEMISRAQLLLGDEFRQLPLISMLCLNLEGSLTNNSQFGVDRLTGPSAPRKAYSGAYGDWQKSLPVDGGKGAALAFPPASDQRPFPAPEPAIVPFAHIRRNFANHTGLDPVCDEPVTAICTSRRPWFAERVARMMAAQTHKNLHMIYVVHNTPGQDLARLRSIFRGFKSATILEVSDAETPLGGALNVALEHCRTDLCTKIDDDDFYGPNYIRSSVAALRYSGHDNVGVVGRGCAYVYLEERDLLSLRFRPVHQNTVRTHVFGATIFWSRSAVSDQPFVETSLGEDTNFLRQAHEKGSRLFSTEAADYVYLRYAAKDGHTWKIAPDELLKVSTPVASGLRLDLVYSTPMPARPATLPGRTPPSKRLVECPLFTALLKEQRQELTRDENLNRVVGTLFSKQSMKTVVRRLVPGLRTPLIYSIFPSIEAFTPPPANVFVLKPCHGSFSRGVFILQKTDVPGVFRELTEDILVDKAHLASRYEKLLQEKPVQISEACFCEEYVRPNPGSPIPHDYKFFAFAGEIALVSQRVVKGRSNDDSSYKFWSAQWQDLGPVKYPTQNDPGLPRPPHHLQATRLAAQLSACLPLPFCRIDLYANDDGVFFGETTPFPNGGRESFDTATDTMLADHWARSKQRLAGLRVDHFLAAAVGDTADLFVPDQNAR
jgi:glycosyltransferase involved in cell wall biosynthesis